MRAYEPTFVTSRAMGDMWSGLESSLKATEGLFPVGQPLRDCADLLKRPPAGQQSIWKPGLSVWHRAEEQAAPDCGGCVRVDAMNTGADGLLNSVAVRRVTVSSCMSHPQQKTKDDMRQWCFFVTNYP